MSFNLKDMPTASHQLQIFLNDPKKKFCFLNGPGGTGKTYSVSKLLELYTALGTPLNYRFLTPTGKAASVAKGYNMEASTFYAIFELLNYSSEKDVEAHLINKFGSLEQYYNKVIKRKFYDENVSVVFIDEVSMVNNEMLQFIIEAFARTDKLIKLVFSGDFHQIDAVISPDLKKENPFIDGSLECLTLHYYQDPSVFEIIEFNTRYRSGPQFDDFNEDLHNLRNGTSTKTKKAELLKLLTTHFNVYDGELSEDIAKDLMFIEWGNNRVKTVNNEFIYRLLGRNLEPSDYAKSKIVVGDTIYEKIIDVPSVEARNSLKNMQFKEEVPLIKGTKILFLVNSEFYKNGDEGFIETIKRDSVMVRKKVGDQYVLMEIEKHEYKSDERLNLGITVTQWPFDLAYARTSHKSQGDGFSNLHLNFMEGFNKHAHFIKDLDKRALANWKFIYVCISRVIDPSTVWISRGSINALMNEKDFFPRIDFDRLNFNVDKYENNGYIRQTK